MFEIFALLLGVLSPLSSMSAVQPDTAQLHSAEPAVRQAVVHFAQKSASRAQVSMSRFDTMNGISLNDTKKDVLAKKGKPLQVTQDRLTGCHEYHYKDAVIGVCEDVVDYVHIAADSGKMQVNGAWVPLKKADLERTFGKPQFVAEDGNVFIRGYHAIKVYTNSDTGALEGVDFFDSTTE
ncbi:hypothetical protein GRF59_27395 [Paenibacillus sp. HJL G12]|uniref:Uncharacterized protein n=1 Tax=Paenibacillus dendrobii TaxID=2691084 RepID=A0A7X3IR11_9BACL|nr:hypothetical protein [Paenibacillus dendrobii]MWV47325.1 hypothetical protein [Paenibacillus dendrobii]